MDAGEGVFTLRQGGLFDQQRQKLARTQVFHMIVVDLDACGVDFGRNLLVKSIRRVG